MKNKKTTKRKETPKNALMPVGKELKEGGIVITKIGRRKVKLTAKIISDVFALIMNAQDGGKGKIT